MDKIPTAHSGPFAVIDFKNLLQEKSNSNLESKLIYLLYTSEEYPPQPVWQTNYPGGKYISDIMVSLKKF